jgi:hypothetical protein
MARVPLGLPGRTAASFYGRWASRKAPQESLHVPANPRPSTNRIEHKIKMSAPTAEDANAAAAVRLLYFLRIPNVGDRVNPAVVTGLTGIHTRFTADPTVPHLLAAGSLMAGATPTSIVWGTGVMHPDIGLGLPRPEAIFAVRGKLSAMALRQAGLLARDVPLGDPGMLAARLLGVRGVPRPTYPLGVVSHYVDRQHAAVKQLLLIPGVRDLDVRLEPAEFLAAMAECAAVASSSLHGLIFAESLGLPSLWFEASGDVAGDGFKFRDWFSTTIHPQTTAHRLTGRDRPEDLARRAERRGSAVSAADLEAAFPHERIAAARDARPCRVTVAMARCRTRPMPVFVISFNRGAMLLRCLAGLRRLSRPTVPVIHDNGSTDPATLRVLADLEAQGVRVRRGPPIATADELDGTDRTVAEYFADWSEPSRYVVTDCDVDMSVANPDALDVYDELLNLFRKAACVGPMLRIRDIRRSYPLYGRIMNRHIEQFWHQRPAWVETAGGRIAVQECFIDTTFALHRAGEPFRRLKPAVRVYEPYEALHLDWYEETRDLDGSYKQTSHPAISHWNNRAGEDQWRNEGLHYDRFHAVRRTPEGGLEEYVCHVPPPD